MLSRPRFWLYRNVIALFMFLSFRSQHIVPLEAPSDDRLEYEPYADAYPHMPLKGVWMPTSFPPGDQSDQRLRRIKLQTRLLGLVKKIAPPHTPPVARGEQRMRGALYPRFFRKAWPAAPVLPAVLADSDDLLAELAVRGPYASYLRRGENGAYVVDVDWIAEYEVAPGLARPGGAAVFSVRDGRLCTESVGLAGLTPEHAQAAYITALNEDLTTFRHNVSVHLTMLTSFALATGNCLRSTHPVRRLLHHCFNTVLIGNVELASAQLSGPQGFAATIFSHEADELLRMVHDHLAHFDFWDFEPDTQFARRGTGDTPFPYPYRDNVMRLWAPTREYVEAYLCLYYVSDDDVAADARLVSWADELERLLPNGIGIPAGGITFEWLTRVCATLIHVSTVEHDILNNVIWNYSTFGWLIPTVVPQSGEPMDMRRAFDMVATLIPTWKPYNMLLTSDIPALALDDEAQAVMTRWLEELDRIQNEMDAVDPRDPTLSYPSYLNVSISN